MFDFNYIVFVMEGLVCFEFDIGDLKHVVKKYLHDWLKKNILQIKYW